MVEEINQSELLIQIDSSSFAEFEISEYEILRFDCSTVSQCLNSIYCSFHISFSNAFRRLLFNYFLYLAETFMMCVNVFYVVRNQYMFSVGFDKK